MAYYIVPDTELTTLADIIRTKKNSNQGLTFPNDFKTALNNLYDTSDANATASDILANKTAYVNGNKIIGNISTKIASNIYPSLLDQTIEAGKYLEGTQTIKAIKLKEFSASNIKYNKTVKIGDIEDDDRVTSVTGTFTKADTVSSGQTAATSANILQGYSAWVDGAEVKGTIASKTINDVSIQDTNIIIDAGYYPYGGSKNISGITLAAPASGTKTFTITAPNGTNNTTTFRFVVDENGNTTIN